MVPTHYPIDRACHGTLARAAAVPFSRLSAAVPTASRAPPPPEAPEIIGDRKKVHIVSTILNQPCRRRFLTDQLSNRYILYYNLVFVDSHIQRLVLTTEETTVNQQVSHRYIKYKSRSWSQGGIKVNGSHHGENRLLLKPTNRDPSLDMNPCQIQPHDNDIGNVSASR